jgi:hypothetical protein
MPSKEYLEKLKLILNESGNYTDEQILYIGEKLIRFYKLVSKIMENNKNEIKTKNKTV